MPTLVVAVDTRAIRVPPTTTSMVPRPGPVCTDTPPPSPATFFTRSVCPFALAQLSVDLYAADDDTEDHFVVRRVRPRSSMVVYEIARVDERSPIESSEATGPTSILALPGTSGADALGLAGPAEGVVRAAAVDDETPASDAIATGTTTIPSTARTLTADTSVSRGGHPGHCASQ